MSNDKIQLKATERDVKANMRKIRLTGVIPAVLYGHNVKNQALSINLGEFEKVLRKAGESTIIDLVTADGTPHPVLIQEVQIHYLTSRPIHADFYQVSMTQKLKTKVVLEFSGESKAVKELGGVLVKNLNEVEVECLPGDLPHSIPVNISVLTELNSAIHVKDLKVSDKVRVMASGDDVVATIQPPREVEADLSAPVVEDVSKVEGAAEEKPAAETDAKAGDKPEKAEKSEKKEEKK